jgi:hypothetical protein
MGALGCKRLLAGIPRFCRDQRFLALKQRKDSAQYEQDFYSFCHISALGCVTQHRLQMRCEGYEMLHLVYVGKAGAYINAMARTFDGFPPPAVIVA